MQNKNERSGFVLGVFDLRYYIFYVQKKECLKALVMDVFGYAFWYFKIISYRDNRVHYDSFDSEALGRRSVV